MSDYSLLDRVFHRLVLEGGAVGEMLFDLESGRFGATVPPVSRPVHVTGLARAGTTVLMRALHASGQFASLTYADMPAVLAPNLWAGLSRSGRKPNVAAERAHGDGVSVDFDAPEALEEVFWRVLQGGDYIRDDALVPHVPAPEVLEQYRLYQALVCRRHSKGRYLAKNNNLMLRLAPLADAQLDAVFLVPVRDPVAQAQSLRAQHLRFRDADRFTGAYMRWLVHHEFGPDQRPYSLPGHPVPEGPRERLDYWLALWVACYGYLLERIWERPRQIHPVIYESLGEDPGAWTRVRALTGLGAQPAAFRPAQAVAAPADVDAGLLERARALHAELRALAEAKPVWDDAAAEPAAAESARRARSASYS